MSAPATKAWSSARSRRPKRPRPAPCRPPPFPPPQAGEGRVGDRGIRNICREQFGRRGIVRGELRAIMAMPHKTQQSRLEPLFCAGVIAGEQCRVGLAQLGRIREACELGGRRRAAVQRPSQRRVTIHRRRSLMQQGRERHTCPEQRAMARRSPVAPRLRFRPRQPRVSLLLHIRLRAPSAACRSRSPRAPGHKCRRPWRPRPPRQV